MASKRNKKNSKKGKATPKLINHIKSLAHFVATEEGKSYRAALDKYRILLNIIQKMSRNQGGITTDGRGVRSMKIFTRETCLAISLFQLLPYSMERRLDYNDFCDLVAISSITRGILECYHCMVYFGTEKISENEAHLRFKLSQHHRNIEWLDSFKNVDIPNNDWKKEFIEGIPQTKEEILSLPFINELTKPQKDKVKKFNAIYKTKAEYAQENIRFSTIGSDYKILSNFSHPVFISLERIDNINGKGDPTPADANWATMFIGLAIKYLSFSVMEIIGYFPDHFEKILGSDMKVLERIYGDLLPKDEAVAIVENNDDMAR